MKVDIWSDIRCPFCYVGKKNFEKALDQFPHKDKVEVTWHSFQLDPDLKTQPEKNSLEYFAEAKRVSPEQAKEMHDHVSKAGKDAGINFNFEHQKIANSYRASFTASINSFLSTNFRCSISSRIFSTSLFVSFSRIILLLLYI